MGIARTLTAPGWGSQAQLRYDLGMPRRAQAPLEVECPCCRAQLRIDAATGVVLSYEPREEPRSVENLEAALARLKAEEARRAGLFEKKLAEQKAQQAALDRKFEELLRKAKEKPDVGPQPKDIDLD